MTSAQRNQLNILFIQLLEGDLDGGALQSLHDALEDTQVQAYFASFIELQGGLYSRSLLSQSYEGLTSVDMSDCLAEDSVQDQTKTDEVKQRAERKLQAFLREQEQQRRLLEQQQRRSQVFRLNRVWLARKVKRSLTLMARFSVAAGVLMILSLIGMGGLQHYRNNRIVGTLGDCLDAQWDLAPDGNDLRPGMLHLQEGYAQIHLKQGAGVLVQAPCTFELLSPNRLYLERGALFANVPKEASGFTVDTPVSKIVDFGTEFGAQVGGGGNHVEIHVFKGDVGIGGKQSRIADLQDVRAGKAVVLDDQENIQVHALADRTRLFVRSLPDEGLLGVPGRRIDLADLVGNGNGYGSGEIGFAIDLKKGQSRPFATIDRGVLARGYVTTPTMPFIDGVFVPDGGGTGRIVVSSTDLMFEECPETLGRFHGHLVNGAVFGGRLQETMLLEDTVQFGRLQGQNYASKAFASIGMHANAGITFDLEALRCSIQDHTIVRFRALCGISETVVQFATGPDADYTKRLTTDFWVLVDGKKQFHRRLKAVPSESVSIDVELSSTARFLTLMTTDCEQCNDFCWAMFAQPVLVLEPYVKTKAW
ncbi:NPCBM/NEW2 domain-containing protein [Planctomycetota bacterium]